MKYLDKFVTWVVILAMFMLFCKFFCVPVSTVAMDKAKQLTEKIDKLNENFDSIEKFSEQLEGGESYEGFNDTYTGTDFEDVFRTTK